MKKLSDSAFQKKLASVKKMIGLARDVDGLYRPTNEKSEAKIRTVLALRGFLIPEQIVFDEVQLSVLRDQARQAGFKIFTTAGRIYPPENFRTQSQEAV